MSSFHGVFPYLVSPIDGVGWMAGPACIIPRESVRLYELCMEQRWVEARELQQKLWGLNEVFARFNLAACIKAGLQIQGYDVENPVPPAAALNDVQRQVVQRALSKLS